jgi:heptosyltransferase-1
MNASPRILIIRLSSLGDILHALPAFAGLRSSFPNARIDWLVGKGSRFLLSAIPGIDSVHVLDADALRHLPGILPAWNQAWRLIQDLRSQRYDFSLDFQGLLKTALIGAISGSRTRLGFSKRLVREPPAHWFYHQTLDEPDRQLHVVALNQMLAGLIGARSLTPTFDFLVSGRDQRHVDSILANEQLEDFVVINPGGGWPTKRWEPKRYGDLAAKIQKAGLPVVVTTGPGEEAFFDDIAGRCGNTPPRHLQLSFLQLIPLLRKARLLIGGDTGPFHLACALGTPVVGIFGPTSPDRNGPWRAGDEVVMHRLPCSFCHKRSCPTKNECMDITATEVFAAVIRRLGNREGFPKTHSPLMSTDEKK